MKLSEAQQTLLDKLSKPYGYALKDHPSDAYNQRTVESLLNKELVKIYYNGYYIHGAIKLTDKGKEVLENGFK